jgi:hypothetical protein
MMPKARMNDAPMGGNLDGMMGSDIPAQPDAEVDLTWFRRLPPHLTYSGTFRRCQERRAKR